jgi:mitochondrial inner membrane protease subunit 2
MGPRGGRVPGYVKQMLWSLAAGVTFNDLIGSVIRIDGLSMQPTLNPSGSTWSDWVLVDKISIKLLRQYSRGEVVILL